MGPDFCSLLVPGTVLLFTVLKWYHVNGHFLPCSNVWYSVLGWSPQLDGIRSFVLGRPAPRVIAIE